jgi:hypothetical protein
MLWYLWQDVPDRREVVLLLGADGPLTELTLECQDDHELSSGGSWRFSSSRPAEVVHEAFTTRNRLDCELALTNGTHTKRTQRTIEFEGARARLPLEQMVKDLESDRAASDDGPRR